MTGQENIDLNAIDLKIRPRLIRIGRIRTVVRFLTVAVYSTVLCWFGFCAFVFLSGRQVLHVQSEDTWIHVLAGFAAFCLLHLMLMYSLTALKDRESEVMREAVRQMFPGARYRTNGSVPRQDIADSRLFDVFDIDENPAQTMSYGRIEFCREEDGHPVYDIGVTSDIQAGLMERIPVLSTLTILYRIIVRPIFGTPIESAMHGFRGIFGSHTGPLSCRGSVIVLPDHLEARLGCLAHSIQSYKSKNGARLVVLEDPGFEKLFAVYADDEVQARKILTPAMMQHIVRLQGKLGKDLMLSFSGNMIYYAVPFPEGFLQPSRTSLKDKGHFRQIYNTVNLLRNIPYSAQQAANL